MKIIDKIKQQLENKWEIIICLIIYKTIQLLKGKN